MGDSDPVLRILIVDDFAGDRKIIKAFLAEIGLTDVTEVGGGRSALKKLREEEIGLVLLDWNMPDLSGLEVLKFIRANEGMKNIPVIMVTSERGKENIVAAMKAGITEYLTKPFTAEALKEKIRNALTRNPEQ